MTHPISTALEGLNKDYSWLEEWARKARQWRREDEAIGIIWAMPSARSGLLRTEPESLFRLGPPGDHRLSQEGK